MFKKGNNMTTGWDLENDCYVYETEAEEEAFRIKCGFKYTAGVGMTDEDRSISYSECNSGRDTAHKKQTEIHSNCFIDNDNDQF